MKGAIYNKNKGDPIEKVIEGMIVGQGYRIVGGGMYNGTNFSAGGKGTFRRYEATGTYVESSNENKISLKDCILSVSKNGGSGFSVCHSDTNRSTSRYVGLMSFPYETIEQIFEAEEKKTA